MKPPLFWLRPPDRPGIWARVLTPLSWIWQAASARRWARGAQADVAVPVICVGNINIGGTGKTPTVIELVSRLSDLGVRPHILSRGYGGRLQGPVQVDAKTHSADDVGDEPILLSAFAPTWVAKDRVAGARLAARAGADVVVMDDGMQNPSLRKALTILVVDAAVGFGNGRILPAGPLRQSVAEGIARADLTLAIGSKEAVRSLRGTWPALSGKSIVRGHIDVLQTGMDWEGLKVIAFAGIGRPAKFFDSLRSVGADIAATHEFGDHARIPLSALMRMEREAQATGAQLVTTEKDAARLPKSFQQKVLTLPVRLVLVDPEPLVTALSGVVRSDLSEC